MSCAQVARAFRRLLIVLIGVRRSRSRTVRCPGRGSVSRSRADEHCFVWGEPICGFGAQRREHNGSSQGVKSTLFANPRVPRRAGEYQGSRHGVARCGESNPLVRLEPCLCMVLWQINSACVAGVHTPAKPVCGRHVTGTVVL